MKNDLHSTFIGLTRKRLLLVVVIVGFILSASVFGLQALALIPKKFLPTLMVALGVSMLTFAALSARAERRALAVVLLSSVALSALLIVQFGVLTVAELTHVACFGGLGMALGPARPAYAIATLAILSTGDEVLQALLPYRVGSLADVVLNLVSAFSFYTGWRLFGRGTEGVEDIDRTKDS